MLRIAVPSNDQRKLKKLQAIKELAKIQKSKEITQLPARAATTIKPHQAVKEISKGKENRELRGMTTIIKMENNNKPKQPQVAYRQEGETYWDVALNPSLS